MKVRTMIVHKERSPLRSVDNLLSANVGPVVGHFGMSIDMTPPCLTTISMDRTSIHGDRG
jgi:CheY-specific phosphatase CheX